MVVDTSADFLFVQTQIGSLQNNLFQALWSCLLVFVLKRYFSRACDKIKDEADDLFRDR